ncbi:amino acid ABC transporter permease [Pseudomonas sp. LFM046]|uniref:amino acid ABC transporter permease n=1 Tax=Pseudomonas sp. LFM046 TaxID=1608357 RepID=UPI0005CF9E96|nr:amino acid ABC transporter permease [Pseudomonas sp. LFM046]
MMGSAMFSSLQISDLYFILDGALKTVWLAAFVIVVGTLIGFLMGWLRSISKIINLLLSPIVDLSRSIPLIIQLIVTNSALAILGSPVSPFVCSGVVLSLYMAAYCSEIYKGGFEAVPSKLQRAARSLGMSYIQSFRHITVPIMLQNTFPAWVGIMLGVLKDTSLAAVIGYIELLRSSQIVITRTQEPLIILLGVGLFYFVICYPVSRYSQKLEEGFQK